MNDMKVISKLLMWKLHFMLLHYWLNCKTVSLLLIGKIIIMTGQLNDIFRIQLQVVIFNTSFTCGEGILYKNKKKSRNI